MKHSNQLLICAALAACLTQASPALAVFDGQIDTFEDGTTQNWVVALLGATHPAPPVNVGTGGPDGSGDNYLLLTAVGGAGAGNRLSVINLTQWTGDFIDAGINSIEMDLNNFGSTDLSLRLLFADPLGGPPTNEAFSSEAVVVLAGSGWTSASFPISPADLTAGLGSVTAALTNATEMRIYHSPTAEFPGPPMVASLGVDNIEAVRVTPIPVPSALAIASFGVLTLLSWNRSARKKER